jgi:predicted  nucleic acid-binding Zn-ribbon protein
MILQLERRRFANTIKRKDNALESLENEVETLNNKISALANDLSRRRRMSGENAIQMVQTLEVEKSNLESELQAAKSRLEEASMEVDNLKSSHEKLSDEHASIKEKFTLAEVILRQNNGVHPSETFLEKTQALWQELGVEHSHREAIRQQIESCLEDTCARKLEEQSTLKEETAAAISRVEGELSSMQRALGLSTNRMGAEVDMKLLKRLDWLKQEQDKLRPAFASAVERREKIAQDAEELTHSMALSSEALSHELRTLLQEKTGLSSDDVTPSYRDLSNNFLSRCEEDVSSLRLRKARILVRNTEVKNDAHKLVQEMNLCEEDVINMSIHSIKQRLEELPSWWDQASARTVASCIVQSNGIINATQTFSSHMEIFHESLSSIANGRRKLSSVLREIVTRAQKTLLDTVDQELDASEAYASFHDALFRLPALSKEFVEACITEIDALISGVEAMSQSEIEALTVVWEALNVSMSERGKFWTEIDESTKAMESSTESPFDAVLRICVLDKEQWVLAAVKNSRSSYRKLEARLFKLERIHREVEKRRSRQDSKSRIISLDSELRLLSARLSDFEDKKCNKQRLLTKKSGSSALLKEERFRKQMQGKYASSLEQLASLLKKWKEEEGHSFDPNLLSDEVRALLNNADGADNWVEKRTEFMHLRTVKSAMKRKPERPTRLTPPRKRQVKPNLLLRNGVEGEDGKRRDLRIAPSPSKSSSKPKPLEPLSALKKRKAENKSGKPKNTLASKLRKVAAPESATKPSASRNKRESTTLLPFGNVLSGTPTEKENSNL